MAFRGFAGLLVLSGAVAVACAADDSDVSGGGGTSGFGGFLPDSGSGGSGGGGGTTGGSGGASGGTGGASGGTGGASGGTGGASGGTGGATGGTGGTTGGTGGTTGGTGGATGGAGGATGGTGGATGGTGGATGGTGGATGGTGGATGGTGGTGDTTPPTVVSTSPAGGSTGVSKNTTIQVTFSEAMQVASITTSTSGTTCAGAIQVSLDNFSTCVPMSGAPTPSVGNTVFTLNPASALSSLGAYKVRVTTAAKDAAGNALTAAYTAAQAFTVRYFHTITIDGNNDFAANETFATSSAAYTAYIAWDEGYLYYAMKGPDVADAAVATKWLVAYLSGTPGSTAGLTYNTQSPTLPFSARWHVRWRTNNTFTEAQLWSGSSWGNASWNFTGDVYQSGTFVEMRVPLVDLGSPTTLAFHLGMLNEQNLAEGSYAATPSTSYADGYDPNYAKYLELALGGSVAPSASPIKP